MKTSHLPPSAFRLQPAGAKRRRGFTLMEVNLALLIMGIALVALLGLFPVGLRQADAATTDTTEAAFADLVLNSMRASAQTVTSWGDWTNLTSGVALGVSASSSSPISINGVNILGNGTPQTINDYLVSGQYIQYALTLTPGPNPMIVKASIQVTNRRYTDVTKAPIYATSFVYTGM